MTRAKKGDVVGSCRYCGKPLVYAGTGRRPRVCKRKACVRADTLSRVHRVRAKRALDVTATEG
jgi:hypothetical protein